MSESGFSFAEFLVDSAEALRKEHPDLVKAFKPVVEVLDERDSTLSELVNH